LFDEKDEMKIRHEMKHEMTTNLLILLSFDTSIVVFGNDTTL
jgi:hypothetical protein